MNQISIDADIRYAKTMPGRFYRDPDVFEQLKEKVLARSWQWVGHERDFDGQQNVRPFSLLPGHLDEPLVLTKDADQTIRCLSNVCTHRANLVARETGSCKVLSCGYHGRRFDLKGRLLGMPEFEGVEDFPSASDHLPEVPYGSFGGQQFVSLKPPSSFDQFIAPVRDRVGDLPFDEFRFDPLRSREYLVQANWVLYVENYLEGFHIPYVHPDLVKSVDYDSYAVEIFDWSNLQLAKAKGGERAFDRPLSKHDEGASAAAYYFWLFPNTTLNFYPWGLSVNVIRPLAIDRTKVSFYSYVWRPDYLDEGAGGALDKVEREDEDVVECVQRGMRSRLYQHGRYSVKREAGVHHFHRLLSQALAEDC